MSEYVNYFWVVGDVNTSKVRLNALNFKRLISVQNIVIGGKLENTSHH